jgi:tetratricopeptide (TPR) repeat protein
MRPIPQLALALLVACATTSLALTPAAVQNAGHSTSPGQSLNHARAEYFRDLQGDSAAGRQATKDFQSLLAAHPHNPVLMAYSGSLTLLKAAHTWAFWNKQSLAQQGLAEMDKAVAADPGNLEARFIRGASCWHLPFFFHRRQQAERDLTFVAVRAKQAVQHGQLPPQLGAAALDYYGKILTRLNQPAKAQQAFREARNIDPDSLAGRDAAAHLNTNG